MSTNNMGNHNVDASKNKDRSRSDVDEAQHEGVTKLDSPETDELGSLISSFLEEFVDVHGAPLNLDLSLGLANRETDSVVRSIHAEEDVPTHEHAEGVLPDLKKPSLEAEHNGQSSGKTINDFAMKDVKLDSSRGQELRIGTHNFEESKRVKNPPAPMIECAEGKTISDFKMKVVKPDSSRGPGPGLELGTRNIKELEHVKIPSVSMYEHAKGRTISEFKMKDVKPDSSSGHGLELGLGTGNFKESEHAKNPPVPLYEHAKGKTISDFKMKEAKPVSSRVHELGLQLGIGNFEEWHAKNPPVPLYEHAKRKTTRGFKMKGDKPDSSRGHELGLGLRFRLGTGNFKEWYAKNPKVPLYEHAKGKTISDFKMSDAKPDSSRGHGLGLPLGIRNFKEWHAKNPPVPMYEHAKGKTISDFKMKDVKPASSRGQRLGQVTMNFLGSEHAKNPAVPLFDEADGKTISGFKMKDVKPDSSSRHRLGLGIQNFESEKVKNSPIPTCEHVEGKTISDFKMKDVKPDSSRGQGLRLRLRIGNFEEWHAKKPSIPMNEHATGKTISNFKMKDVKPDSSRGQRLGLVTENFRKLENGKNCPVPRKDGHCSSGDVHIYKHAKGNAEDNDQDLRMKTCDFKTKDIEPERGKNSHVYKQEGCCSRADVSMQEHAAILKVNLTILGTDSLRRYIRHFKIEGTNPRSSRETILNAVERHFASQPQLNEQQVIPEFVIAARKIKGKPID